MGDNMGISDVSVERAVEINGPFLLNLMGMANRIFVCCFVFPVASCFLASA